MTDETPPGDELFIHLDLDGLVLLMKAAKRRSRPGAGGSNSAPAPAGIAVSGIGSFAR